MRLGFQTLTWGRTIDDLDHTLAVIAACGYEGVEFGQSPKDIFVHQDGKPQKPIGTLKALQERLQRYNLSLVGLEGGTLEERMEFCKDDRTAAYLYVDTWSSACEEALNQEIPYRLALHPHWFMPIRRLHHAELYLDRYQTNNLQLIIDTAHFTIAADDPVAAAAKHVKRLASVHLKDWKPDFGRWSHRYAHGFCLPEQGIIPLREMLKVLNQEGFDGWVIMEQEHYAITREGTALICAQWAHKFTGSYFRPFFPDSQKIKELVEANKKRGPLYQPSAFELIEQAKLITGFLLNPPHSVDALYSSITQTIKRFYKAEAVKLWSYNSTTEEICLLSAQMDGHVPIDISTWNYAKKSLTGKVNNNARILTYDLKSDETRAYFYDNDKDKKFLEALKTRWMIVVPILNLSNPHHLRYILTIFPSADSNITSEGNLHVDHRLGLQQYADIASLWADYVTDEACSAAAGATNYLCGEVKEDVTTFVNKLMEHLEKQFGCENVTIWLLDETRSRLLPAGNTEDRIRWNPDLPESARFYNKGDKTFTSKTWEENEMQFFSHARDFSPSHKSFEKTTSNRWEMLTAPLSRRGGEVFGVVKLHNKIDHGIGPASTMFTDHDAARLDSIIQAALPHLELLIFQERQLSAVTRMVHEFQMPMVAIRAAVDFMQHTLFGKRQSAKEIFGEDYLSDILNWSSLMGRLANNARIFSAKPGSLPLRPSKTWLKSEIIGPAVNQVGALLHEHGFDSNCIYYGDFGDIPQLWIDRQQFQQVVFNLLANSIKYAEKGKLKVRINAGQHGNSYMLWFEDWGPGIESGTEELMFQPGYRSRSAMRKDVAGQGIGLSVVRNIIEAHGGRVKLTSNREPTRFELSLPISLRHSPPGKSN